MSTLSPESVEEALQTSGSASIFAAQAAKAIQCGTYDISHFVDVLGFALTATSVDSRVKGTQLLSNLLKHLPNDFLNATQLEFLSTFYADRLKDHHNVMPAIIDGIDALVHMKNLQNTCVPTILQSFFQHTTCQSQTRSDRLKIFQIFKYLTENYTVALKSMSADFIYGLINSIDGERDPRNLDFIFSFMPAVIANYPMLHLNEEMFETFACYFPVDFTPSNDDPDTITREALSKNLTKCLVASEEFVEWTVALAIEKLETDLAVARMDSLELLQAAALNFEPKILEPHFEQIWKALKSEVFPGSDNTAIVAAALSTLRNILERAAKLTEISHNYQTIVLGNILPHLNDVGQRLFNPATAIALVCVAGDASFAAEKVLNAFQLKLNSASQADEDRIKIYTIIAQVYKIASLHDNTLEKLNNEVALELQKDLITSLRRDMEDPSEQALDLKRAALSVFNECAPIISEANRVLVYQALVRLITHEQVDLEFTHLLEQLGALYPIEFQSNVLDVCIRNFAIFEKDIKSKVLRNLLPLVHQMAFSKRILDVIFGLIFQEAAKTDDDDVRDIALEALSNLLNTCDNRFVVELQEQNSIIDKLVKLAQSEHGQVLPLSVLERLAAVISLIMQKLSVSEQYTIVTEYLPTLNLQIASDLYIAKGLLGYLHQDISLDDDFERLLTDLTTLSLKSDNEQLQRVANHLLCSMVNKIACNEQNKNVIVKVIDELKMEIKRENAKAVESLSWLAKGLIVRGYEGAAEIVQSLANLLKHPSLATAATLAFNIISAEFPELHLPVMKALFKQRYFQMIMEKFDTNLKLYCEHHVKAFVYVLKTTPHGVLRMNIEKIGPILFNSLECKKTETLCIVLTICERFIKHQDEYFRRHLNHIIPSCLKLSKFKESMKVRIAALTLLYDISTYPTFALLAYKTDVVLGLVDALDDSKRLVRNVAVSTRNVWYLIGEN